MARRYDDIPDLPWIRYADTNGIPPDRYDWYDRGNEPETDEPDEDEEEEEEDDEERNGGDKKTAL